MNSRTRATVVGTWTWSRSRCSLPGPLQRLISLAPPASLPGPLGLVPAASTLLEVPKTVRAAWKSAPKTDPPWGNLSA